ncbi:tetratricopeptide repeat protein [Treponema maltophilum]|uniref:tetratricopeptide repeat protein n=1 Tax=Treponema maltophilum TaxID=51160 RepID=UPI003D915866
MKAFTAALCCLVICVLCFVPSCSSGSSSGIFAEKLEVIDAFIGAEDYGGAWRLLKKNKKYVRSPRDYLSLIRRALLLDKNDFAEKYMRKGLSVFPDNQELLAVYAHFLLSLKRYEEAAKYAPKLEGGRYGSLYAELRFRTAGSEKNPSDFLSPSYIQAYIDSALTTGNGAYIRNAAVIYALQGDMQAAFRLHPKTMSVYDYPEFWARISFDSGNFVQCAEDVGFAKPSPELSSLASDALLHAGDERGAVLAWIDSTERFPSSNPASWYNASRAALKSGSMGYAYLFLSSLVRRFPDYVPGLAAYGRFSVYTPPQTKEHIFSNVLREKGIKTLSMELDDELPRVAPEEALARMNESLARTDDASLALEKLKLQWRVQAQAQEKAHTQAGPADSSASARKKAADIWALLERRAGAGYDPLTVRFALWNFCRYGMIDEASELFDLWCASRYAPETDGTVPPPVPATEGKNKQVVPKERIVPFKEEWEYDIGSYIAFKQGRYARAEEILTAAMNNKNIKPGESVRLNLALLYNGSSRRVQALALYRNILEDDRIDKKLQAEIYYKIAVIQREQKENRSAVLSLNQALALDPAHSRSRFMLKQLDSAAD